MKTVTEIIAGITRSLQELVAQIPGATQRAISMERVWSQIAAYFRDNDYWDYTTYPVDIYYDRGDLYLIMVREGKLLRASVTIEDDSVMMGDPQEVVESFIPVTSGGTDRAVARAIEQEDGRVRVIVIGATAVINRDGEIDTTELFDDFVERINTTGVYPKVNFHHHPEVRLGEVDFVAREGWCYLMSYVFDDTPIGRAAGAGYMADPEFWGHSIEFFALESEPMDINGVEVIANTRGINTGLALLSEHKASSLFTNRGVTADKQTEERMKKSTVEDLQKLVGADLAAETAQTVDRTNEEIDDGGMIRRLNVTAETTESTDEEAEAEQADETQVDGQQAEATEDEAEQTEETGGAGETVYEFDDQMLDALADRLAERQAATTQESDDVVAQLVERVNQLVDRLNQIGRIEQRVGELERQERNHREAVVADTPQRPPQVTRVSYRPSQQHQQPVHANGRARSNGALDGEDFDQIAQDTLDSLPPLTGRR